MNNKIIAGAISTVVILILVAAVLSPVLEEAQDNYIEKTPYDNNILADQIYLSAVDAHTSSTITASVAGVVTNNGTILPWEGTYANVILLTNNLYVTMTGAGSITVQTLSGSSTCSTFTAVISAGEITYSLDSADSITLPYIKGYVADPKGDHVSCYSSATKYFKNTNFAQTRYDSGTFYAYIDGVGYRGGTTEAPMTVDSAEVVDTDGQIKTLTAIKYTSTKSLNSICVMPKSAVYEDVQNQGMISLLGAIIPLALCALLVGIVIPMTRRN